MNKLESIENLKREMTRERRIDRLKVEEYLKNPDRTPEAVSPETAEKMKRFTALYAALSPEESIDDPALSDMNAYFLTVLGEKESAQKTLEEDRDFRAHFIGAVAHIPEVYRESALYRQAHESAPAMEELKAEVRTRPEYGKLQQTGDRKAFSRQIQKILIGIFMEDISRYALIQNNAALIEKLTDELYREEHNEGTF